ncbi:MAG: polyphenol oxidase family protein [Micrococcaceae bacterium]
MFEWSRTLTSGTFLFYTGAKDISDTVPHGSTNLAYHVPVADYNPQDFKSAVTKNREELAQLLKVSSVQYMSQTHGNRIAVFKGKERLSKAGVANTDALVFTGSGAAGAVMVADCVPVILFDDEAGVYAVAHAGRAGVLNGIVKKTIAKMENFGASAVSVVLGPSICADCYEVPKGLAKECEAQIPGSTGKNTDNKFVFKLKDGIRIQLTENETVKEIIDVNVCTLENENFFSYRRDNRAGRFIGGIKVA